MNASESQPTALTVGELLCSLLPRLRDEKKRHLPDAPVDLFALMSVLIQRSGAYSGVLENFPRARWSLKDPADYREWTARKALEWIKATLSSNNSAHETADIWRAFLHQTRELAITDFPNAFEASYDALVLLAIADEASAAFSKAQKSDQDPNLGSNDSDLWFRLLTSNKQIVESEVDPSRVIVLPKWRTPQNGLNIRSLSHHLCAIEGCEVKPDWIPHPSLVKSSQHVNILLFPWPFSISPRSFRAVDPSPSEMANMSDSFGFFAYKPQHFSIDGVDSGQQVAEVLQSFLDQARSEVESIDVVVLPECAVTRAEWAELEKLSVKLGFTLISGVGDELDEFRGSNEVWVKGQYVGKVVQKKHHRWQLDKSQILNYQLASRLNPQRRWWENIPIKERQVTFMEVNPWLCVLPLICEDLARPDPVGELVRAVGPDLVIALLMDGPQLLNRWTARNAMILADDPGCSVLTLTSLGMIDLSNTRRRQPRIVPALFKDPVNGVQELEFPPGIRAAVLTLNRTPREEWTADGRLDEQSNTCPTLGSIRYLK